MVGLNCPLHGTENWTLLRTKHAAEVIFTRVMLPLADKAEMTIAENHEDSFNVLHVFCNHYTKNMMVLAKKLIEMMSILRDFKVLRGVFF